MDSFETMFVPKFDVFLRVFTMAAQLTIGFQEAVFDWHIFTCVRNE